MTPGQKWNSILISSKLLLSFHHEDSHPPDIPKDNIIKWFSACLCELGKEGGEINIIFCSDHYLTDLNKQYLDREYLTDIITFDYSEGNLLSGDLFISTDRVKENALVFNALYTDELRRVMIHGLLHLAGLDDQTKEEKEKMRQQEDKYLELYASICKNENNI